MTKTRRLAKQEKTNARYLMFVLMLLNFNCVKYRQEWDLSRDLLGAQEHIISDANNKIIGSVRAYELFIKRIFEFSYGDYPDFEASSGYFCVKYEPNHATCSVGIFFDKNNRSIVVVKKVNVDLERLYDAVINYPNTDDIALLVQSKIQTIAYKINNRNAKNAFSDYNLISFPSSDDLPSRPRILDGGYYLNFVFTESQENTFTYKIYPESPIDNFDIKFSKLLKMYDLFAYIRCKECYEF